MVMTQAESVDIDEPWDLELATWLIERREAKAHAPENNK